MSTPSERIQAAAPILQPLCLAETRAQADAALAEAMKTAGMGAPVVLGDAQWQQLLDDEEWIEPVANTVAMCIAIMAELDTEAVRRAKWEAAIELKLGIAVPE